MSAGDEGGHAVPVPADHAGPGASRPRPGPQSGAQPARGVGRAARRALRRQTHHRQRGAERRPARRAVAAEGRGPGAAGGQAWPARREGVRADATQVTCVRRRGGESAEARDPGGRCRGVRVGEDRGEARRGGAVAVAAHR